MITLQNDIWQVGILPQTGASIAFGRVRHGDGWIDVFRPTAENDYGNSSKTSSFIMLPWCNRIRDGKLRFQGKQYLLKTVPDDGTARHGDVRNRPWSVKEQDETHTILIFDSFQFDDINFPFKFSAQIEYQLEAADFVWKIKLTNQDSQPIPAGFGFHPYFVRPSGKNTPRVTIPCNRAFRLVDYLAVAAPEPLSADLDFRQPRELDSTEFNDLLTDVVPGQPTVIDYPETGIYLDMMSDPIFAHVLLYTPSNKPFFAVEPMSNANDGFNLFKDGIEGSGVVVVQPGDSVSGEVHLNLRRKA